MTPNPITAVFCLVLIGLSVRMALRLFYGARGPSPGDPMFLAVSVLAWGCLLSGLVAIGIGLFIGALVPFLIALQSGSELVAARRKRQRSAAWSTALRAVEHGRPVGDALKRRAQVFRGRVGRAIHRLVDDLDSGLSLAPAVAANPGAFPSIAPPCLALSRDNASLLRKAAVAVEDDHGDATPSDAIRGLMLAIGVGLFAFIIVTGVMVYIVPSFRDIFYEFGLEIPGMTESIISLAGAARYSFVPMVAICVLLVIYLVASYFLPERFVSELRILYFPWLRRNALQLLATAVEQRVPLDEALRRLSLGPATFPDRKIRRRLATAAASVEAGDNWRAALGRGRFLSSREQELLRSAEAAGNLSWALRSVANRQFERSIYRRRGWLRLISVAAIVAFGVFVGWFAIGMFVPLIALIEGLS